MKNPAHVADCVERYLVNEAPQQSLERAPGRVLARTSTRPAVRPVPMPTDTFDIGELRRERLMRAGASAAVTAMLAAVVYGEAR